MEKIPTEQDFARQQADETDFEYKKMMMRYGDLNEMDALAEETHGMDAATEALLAEVEKNQIDNDDLYNEAEEEAERRQEDLRRSKLIIDEVFNQPEQHQEIEKPNVVEQEAQEAQESHEIQENEKLDKVLEEAKPILEKEEKGQPLTSGEIEKRKNLLEKAREWLGGFKKKYLGRLAVGLLAAGTLLPAGMNPQDREQVENAAMADLANRTRLAMQSETDWQAVKDGIISPEELANIMDGKRVDGISLQEANTNLSEFGHVENQESDSAEREMSLGERGWIEAKAFLDHEPGDPIYEDAEIIEWMQSSKPNKFNMTRPDLIEVEGLSDEENRDQAKKLGYTDPVWLASVGMSGAFQMVDKDGNPVDLNADNSARFIDELRNNPDLWGRNYDLFAAVMDQQGISFERNWLKPDGKGGLKSVYRTEDGAIAISEGFTAGEALKISLNGKEIMNLLQGCSQNVIYEASSGTFVVIPKTVYEEETKFTPTPEPTPVVKPDIEKPEEEKPEEEKPEEEKPEEEKPEEEKPEEEKPEEEKPEEEKPEEEKPEEEKPEEEKPEEEKPEEEKPEEEKPEEEKPEEEKPDEKTDNQSEEEDQDTPENPDEDEGEEEIPEDETEEPGEGGGEDEDDEEEPETGKDTENMVDGKTPAGATGDNKAESGPLEAQDPTGSDQEGVYQTEQERQEAEGAADKELADLTEKAQQEAIDDTQQGVDTVRGDQQAEEATGNPGLAADVKEQENLGQTNESIVIEDEIEASYDDATQESSPNVGGAPVTSETPEPSAEDDDLNTGEVGGFN